MSSHRDSQRDTACLGACVSDQALRPCDALSIERVVICKSPLPLDRWRETWQARKKEGERDGTRKMVGQRQCVNDRDECEREEGK